MGEEPYLRPSGLQEMMSSVWGSDTMSYLHSMLPWVGRIADKKHIPSTFQHRGSATPAPDFFGCHCPEV